jgi:hypothetical protein
VLLQLHVLNAQEDVPKLSIYRRIAPRRENVKVAVAMQGCEAEEAADVAQETVDSTAKTMVFFVPHAA